MSRSIVPAFLTIALSLAAAAFGQVWQPAPQPQPQPQAGLQAMEWLKPGVRLTYYTSKGTSDTWGVNLVPDPNGQWMDKDHPERKYTEEQAIRMDREPGINFSGGYGARQSDVIAVEPDGRVAVDAKLFTMRPDLNALVLMPGGQGMVGSVEAAPSLWIHPRSLAATLATYEAGPREADATTHVYRTTFTSLDGARQFNAVRIVTRDASGHIQQTYDLDSGVMLLESSAFSSFGTSKAPIVDVKTGQPWQGKRGTTVTYTRFIGTRQLKLPPGAADAPLPPTATPTGRRFMWTGGYKMQSNLDPALDAQIPPSPIHIAGQVQQVGRGFALLAFTDVTPNAIPSFEPILRAVGPGCLGEWIVSPALFNGLQPGAVLDSDPITKNQLVFTGATPDGLCWLEDRGPQHRYIYGYDPRTGQLRRENFTVAQTGLVYNYQLLDQ